MTQPTTLHREADRFVLEQGFAYGLDPLTVIAIIRLAITLYECFSGRALLRTLRSTWGLGAWARRRALGRAMEKECAGMGRQDRADLLDDLDEFVVGMFREMSDDNALKFIGECFESLGLDAQP